MGGLSWSSAWSGRVVWCEPAGRLVLLLGALRSRLSRGESGSFGRFFRSAPLGRSPADTGAMAPRRDDCAPEQPDEPWVDLAGNVAGRRVGAEGEHVVADALAGLLAVSWADRLRGRASAWWVVHSVEVGTGSSDIDHIVGGPPGVFIINTKHHPTGRVKISGDTILVNQRNTDYVTKAQAEARRATRLVRTALGRAGHPELAARTTVRPVLAVVAARLLGRGLPGGVLVATSANLARCLREQPHRLTRADLGLIHEYARRSTIWTAT